ncbi:MAG: hypothetical protein ACI8Y8_004211, partial [Planctomycetota bacterium]
YSLRAVLGILTLTSQERPSVTAGGHFLWQRSPWARLRHSAPTRPEIRHQAFWLDVH